ncbi:MAG: glycosyltransferase family 2 protein [bacterium]|nr:glycosyltransferase family 2 protein [bacterium]
MDSDSQDASVRIAKERGAIVVELDMSIPFTAARARNAGVNRLLEVEPDLQLIQFVDGDCEICPGWLEAAAEFFLESPGVAVLSGLLHERDRSASVYNRLADLEWQNMPVGEGHSSGGNMIVRRTVFERVGGFNEEMIGGEEPDLCSRIRAAGFGVYRLDRDMAIHDSAMFHFHQWWTRQVRSGHSYLELQTLREKGSRSPWARQIVSILFFGGALPLVVLLAAPVTAGASLVLLLVYPLLALRIALRQRQGGTPSADALLYGASCVVGKLPTAQGITTFLLNRFVLHRASTLMEYKGARSGNPDSGGGE